ncbi:MAG: 16S rRNA (guanine(527)-N(7))-methyltransferase RsmG [Peptostreptococcaceae bacterium]|nr:16S rRNA (guanine(527)-N(7))-methyltransferase RsmG [Peptostreptococcaceae bacterium]
MGNKEKLLEELKKNDIEIKDEAAGKMILYMEEILLKNQSINLTAIREEEEFIEKQLIDALLLIKRKEFINSKKIVDIGTGAGFPGVPLAIAFPEKEFVLVDSLNKKLKIIDELCDKLSIKNVRTIHGRAETLGKSKTHREKYDLCVAKAVATMNVLMEYCLPLVKVGGNFIAYKGKNIEDEMVEAEKSVRTLGGEVVEVVNEGYSKYKNIDNHKLVITKKIKKTPIEYPRREGKPAKEPIK